MLKRFKKLSIPLKQGGNKKWIVRDGSEPDEIVEMDVIGYDHSYDEYLVNIPDDVTGFTISQFHVVYYEVQEKLLGKRFNNYYVAGKDSSRSG